MSRSSSADAATLSRRFRQTAVGALHGYRSGTIGIKLRYEDFRTVTRDLTLRAPTADPLVIRSAAGECLRRVPLNQRLRLLGVRAGALSSSSALPDANASAQGELPLRIADIG